jgi:hypothetical protein
MTSVVQDPSGIIKYTGTWKLRFPEGDIADSTWAVTDSDDLPSDDLVISGNGFSGLDVAWTVTCAGDVVVGAVYDVTNHVIMADGQEDDWTIRYTIRQR